MEEERERVLLELIGVAALTTDNQARIRYVNSAGAKCLERRVSDLVGTLLPGFLTGGTQSESAASRLKSAAASGHPISFQSDSGGDVAFRVIELCSNQRYALLSTRDPAEAGGSAHAPSMLMTSISHELASPLTYTLTSIEIALRELDQLPEEALSETLSIVANSIRNAHEGACRMLTIARKMNTMSAMGSSWPVEADLTEVLDHALQLAWNELRHAVSVIKRYTSAPRVMGDQHALARALASLLAIAAEEYREAGATELSLSIHRNGENAKIEIANERPVKESHVWGAADEERLRFPREAIQAAGGQLRLKHLASGGQRCYELEFPLAHATRRSSGVTRTGRSGSASARVLFIDDEPLLAETLQIAFGDEHDVQTATSAKAALALLEKDRDFDLILCDLMMPEQTGAVVFYQLQKLAPELIPRFVLMTGGAFTPSTSKFVEEFQGLTLEKPFQVQDVEALIVQFRELHARR